MDAVTIRQKVRDTVSKGARGIVLLPGLHGFYGNDRRVWPIYEMAQSFQLPILSQTGDAGPLPVDEVRRPQHRHLPPVRAARRRAVCVVDAVVPQHERVRERVGPDRIAIRRRHPHAHNEKRSPRPYVVGL